MTKARILVVASDAALRATLARWLMGAGYAVELAESLKRAREVVAAQSIALAMVAPNGFGPAGVEAARELGKAAGRLITIAEGCEDGGTPASIPADGCIVKPLAQDAVLASVRAALPAPPADETPALPEALQFEGYTLDVAGRVCRDAGGRDVALTRAEFALLLALAQQPGRVVSRDHLRQAAAGRGAEPDDRSVDVLISRLRRKIEPDPKTPRIIVTVPGEGYKFAATPQEAARAGVSGAAPMVVASEPAAAASALVGQHHEAAPDSRGMRTFIASHPVWLMTAAVAAAGIAAIAIVTWKPQHSTASAEKFDASAVPLVTDAMRNDLSAYPGRPDFKAIAISTNQLGIAFGLADRQSAEKDALERCKVRTNFASSAPCRIYATGMDVIWSRRSLPMPVPGDIHTEALDDRLTPAEMPFLSVKMRRALEQYLQQGGPKAFAIRDRARGMSVFDSSSDAAASRLAVERCGDFYQTPCFLFAVNERLTVRVPKSHKVVQGFMLSTEPQMSEDARQRVGEVYRGKEWRALARGKSGGWYPVADAPSEAAAVEAALALCAKSDADCRLYAIGNFRVAEE